MIKFEILLRWIVTLDKGRELGSKKILNRSGGENKPGMGVLAVGRAPKREWKRKLGNLIDLGEKLLKRWVMTSAKMRGSSSYHQSHLQNILHLQQKQVYQ